MRENIFINILSGIRKKIRNGKAPYKKAGLSWLDMRMLKNMPENSTNSVKLLGKHISVYGRIGFLDALKEIFFQEIYKVSLPPEPYVIDCGANIGLSVIYLKTKYPKAKVIAFEPDSRNFSLLKKNIAVFGLTSVDLRNEAVWVEDTQLSFSNEGTMSSKVIETGDYKIKAIRLKNLIKTPVDFLKIDIEGAEYLVLKDIKEELHFVQNMFLEYHGTFEQNHELIELLNILQATGFSFYIKEATSVYDHPFLYSEVRNRRNYDIQLNIFCFRINK